MSFRRFLGKLCERHCYVYSLYLPPYIVSAESGVLKEGPSTVLIVVSVLVFW